MDSSLLDRVRAALNAKYYTVNDSWLKDGVEFYVSEHGQVGYVYIQHFCNQKLSVKNRISKFTFQFKLKMKNIVFIDIYRCYPQIHNITMATV